MGVSAVLKDKAREWAKLVVKLHNTKVPAKLQDEKDFLIRSAKKIKDGIEFGGGALPELEPIAEVNQELGAIFIPVAAGLGLAGAAGAIAWWTNRAMKIFAETDTNEKRKQLFIDLKKEGKSDREAARIASSIYPQKTPMSKEVIKSLVLMGGAGFAVWYLSRRF